MNKHHGNLDHSIRSNEYIVKFLLDYCQALKRGKLFGITETELYLKPGSVIFQHLDIILIYLSTYVNFI